jgi:hypothetical protein
VRARNSEVIVVLVLRSDGVFGIRDFPVIAHLLCKSFVHVK